MTERKDVCIIGLGPAGVSAAVYLKRYGMNPVCFEKENVGGKVNKTERVENYPGVLSLSGMKLGSDFENQLADFSIHPIYKEVKSLFLNPDGTFHVIWPKGEGDFCYVVLANGLKERPFEVEGENLYQRRGISSCAICDGHFYRGKAVAVVGGGNSAFEEACYLATICSHVTLIARREEFRADKIVVERFLSFPNTSIKAPYEIISSAGTNQIESLSIRNKKTHEEETLSLSGLFLYVGEIPQNSFVGIPNLLTADGFVKTDDLMQTNIKNLYAVGDVRDKKLRQIVTAANDGARAAMMIHDDYMKNA